MSKNGFQLVCVFPGYEEAFVDQHLGCVSHINHTNYKEGDFPWNYLKFIRDQVIAGNCVLITSQLQIREGLKNMGLSALLVYPSPECKTEYFKRLRAAGHSEQLIQVYEEHWEKWINELKQVKTEKIELLPGQSLSDVILYSSNDNLIRIK